MKNPRNTETSVIFFDFSHTQSLFNALFNESPSLSLTGNKFGGKHVREPTREDAVKRADQIVEDMMKQDPLYKYQYHKINLKMEKEGIMRWWYGELLIKKMPINKIVSFIKLGNDIHKSGKLSYSIV
jgi:hypothetical protein